MAGESLSAHAVSNVPQLGGGITGAWNEGLGVRAEWQTHHITTVACEGVGLLAGFDIPQCTGEQKFSISYAYAKHIFIHILKQSIKQCIIVFNQCIYSCWPTHHVVSPELVTIWLSLRKRQQDKYPAEERGQILRELSHFINNLDSSDSWLVTWPWGKKLDKAHVDLGSLFKTKENLFALRSSHVSIEALKYKYSDYCYNGDKRSGDNFSPVIWRANRHLRDELIFVSVRMKYLPVCPGSSLVTLTLPSRVFRL